jgi:hypothetical protein
MKKLITSINTRVFILGSSQTTIGQCEDRCPKYGLMIQDEEGGEGEI